MAEPEHTYLYEHIMKVTFADLTCRVWVDHECELHSKSFDLEKYIVDVLTHFSGTTKDMVDRIICIDGINSAEIVDRGGFGVCVHKDWP